MPAFTFVRPGLNVYPPPGSFTIVTRRTADVAERAGSIGYADSGIGALVGDGTGAAVAVSVGVAGRAVLVGVAVPRVGKKPLPCLTCSVSVGDGIGGVGEGTEITVAVPVGRVVEVAVDVGAGCTTTVPVMNGWIAQ